MKTNNLKLNFTLLALLFAFTIKAQLPIDTTGANTHSWLCGNDSTMFANLKTDTAFTNSMARYNSSLSGTSSSSAIIIPVVFHIVSSNPSAVSYAQVQWAVASLNAYFSKDNYTLYTGKTPGPRAVNTNIEFRLACNPMPASGTNTATTTGLAGWSSASEPGVVRYATADATVLNQGVLDATTNNALKALTHPNSSFFPFANYLNIWCVPAIISPAGGTILAFGTFPSLYPSTSSTIDGIVTRIDCIGSNTYANNFPMFASNFEQGGVLAHEVGHYLGLYHTFQPQDNTGDLSLPLGCYGTTATSYSVEGDLILDTPPTQVNFDLGSIPTVNTCTETNYPYGAGGLADEPDQLENYMCYSDDNKRNTFTQGQADRMASSTYTSTAYNRSVLVSPANLTATGVDSWPTSCAAYTGIVTGIFNYNIAAGSGCHNVNIQFTNPSSPDFNTPSTTTYSWTFGDGGTGTGANPIHTYTTSSSFTVSCTATSGTVVSTYSTTVTTDYSAGIIGQSSQMGSNTTATVCKGSEQTIYVQFGPHVPSATITDGFNNYTVNNYMNLNTSEIVPYLFTANAYQSYSMAPVGCGSGVATFNVLDCCSSLLTNGDFEGGSTGFATDLYYATSYVYVSGVEQYGNYDVNLLGSGYFSTAPPFNQLGEIVNSTGKVMQIDGFDGSNGIVTIAHEDCSDVTDKPKIWQEVISGLQPSTTYFYSFKILENYNPSFHCTDGMKFQTDISSGTYTLLPTQSFTPTTYYPALSSTTTTVDWVVYSYTFTTGAISPSDNFSVTIRQVNSFYDYNFDILLDNITLQPMTPPIQAVGNATLTTCTGTTTPISATANCGESLSDYTFSWLPSSSVACYTCASTSASPTTTTVYTLAATPTAGGGEAPPIISTITVTIDPAATPSLSISPSSTAICAGQSATLTATSSASTYTWSTGANTASISVTPSVTTTYTVASTSTVTGCANTQSVTVTINPPLILIPSNPTICAGQSVSLSAGGADTYTWSTGANTPVITVSPTVTTSYSVSGTNTVTSCSNAQTLTVTVNSSPTLTVTPPSVSICAGQSTTLTASGANTYTWSNGHVGASVSGTPTVTTIATFSVTGTNTVTGCTNTATATLTVNPIPTVTISPASLSTCVMQTLTLTASGASTYTWSNGYVGASIIATPTVSTIKTLTVTGTSAAGCTNTAVATITVNPLPTVSVSLKADELCGDGDNTDITATGADTYSWSPASTLNTYTAAIVNASPTVTTTYSVIGTNTLTGCSVTNTITVVVATNSCTATTHTVDYSPSSSYTLSGNPIYVSNDIEVAGINYEINSADIRFKPGVGIHVASNGTLTVIGSWLHSCTTCDAGMWNGISVDGGGTVNMLTGKVSPISDPTVTVDANNIIEDAAIAIHFQPSSTAVTWSITNTIFNNDGIGIIIDNNTGNLSASVINNCVFTCRNLSSHTTSLTAWNSTVADIKTATPTYTSSANPTDFTLGGTRTKFGISVQGTNTVYPVVVGASTYTTNIFDNLDIGIYTDGRSITIQNNRFQNLTGNTDDGTGIGIYSGGDGIPTASLTVGGSATTANTFTNCLSGITTNNANRVYIDYNTFNNENTAPASTATVAGTYSVGYSGVYQTQYAAGSSTTTPESMSFTNNNIQNCNVGHYLDFYKLYNTGDASSIISTNTITAAGTGGQYCNWGIWLQQSGATGAGSTSVKQDAIAITGNSITNAAINAVKVTSVTTPTSATKGFVDIYQNTELSVQYTSTATSSVTPHIAAVYVEGSNYVKIDNNTKIQCTGLSSYSSSDAQYIAGVYVSASYSTIVNCNTVKYVGEGFVWEGASPSSIWYKNNVQYSRYGLVLRNAGIMGDQGSSGHPSGNVFGKYVSTNITNAQTLADNSDPGGTSTSKLFVTSSLSCSSATTYSPCQNNWIGIGSATPYSASTLSVTTGSFPCVCTGDCGSGRLAYNASTMSDSTMSSADSLLLALETILAGIENGEPFPVYDLQTRWALQYYVATQNDSLPAVAGYENARTLAMADAALNENDYGRTQSLLNSVISNNVVEDNWLLVDNLLLKLHSDTLDSTDVVSLNSVAKQCPLIGGNIVYEARALLNNYYKHIIMYADSCNDKGDDSRKANVQSNSTLSKKDNFKIYPNPSLSYDELNIAYFNVESNQPVNIKIADLEGRIVYENSFITTDNKVFKVRGTFLAGTYFVNITTANSTVETHKLVIMPK